MSRESIVFGEPQFDEAERELVLSVLDSGWIGMGPIVGEFESRLGAYLQTPGCPIPNVVTTSSCSEALELALVAAGVGEGDEVITTPFTFVATVNAIERVGAVAVFADIDRETLNLTPDAVAGFVSDRTSAIVPVHFGGRALDVSGFRKIAREHDLWIIEDAAHAIGGWAGGERVGAATDERTLTCFSFYPNKNLASAEGGAITLRDEVLSNVLRSGRLHGLDVDAWERWTSRAYKPSLAVRAGQKSNWTDLQAAIALAQLDKLEGFLAAREFLAGQYDLLVKHHGLTRLGIRPVQRGDPSVAERHALHLYQVMVEGGRYRRDAMVEKLKQQGIGVAVHYLGVHQHPHYRRLVPDGVHYPNADWASDSLISLPLHPGLSVDDLDVVIERMALVAAT